MKLYNENLLARDEKVITIIIPSYNSGLYLAEAIESVLIQTYPYWECLIIDDHSSDNSLDIANRFSEKYPGKINCYTNKGKGACDARNYGIQLSQGSYLKFLDSDDAMYDQDVLQNQLDLLLNTTADIVYGDENYYGDQLVEDKLIKKRGGPINNTLQTFFSNFPITTNFLIKKSSLSSLRWNKKLKSGQEYFLLFQCYLNNLEFRYSPFSTCKIRVHNSTHRISNKPKVQYAYQVYELFAEMLNEIKQHKVSEEDLEEFRKHLLVHSYHSIRFRNFKALKLMQQLLNGLRAVEPKSLKVKLVFNLNSVSPFLGYGLYRFLTFKGKSFG